MASNSKEKEARAAECEVEKSSRDIYLEDGIDSLASDDADMLRLGKKQEYERTFGFVATLGFASMYSLTWEYILISTGASLVNGGFAGAIWEYLWTFAGYLTIVMSLAEMASMAPTAGGLYHWTSEFAPARAQRVLSYVSGWTSVIAWQPALASSLYPLVTMIGAMRAYFGTTFAFTNWQQALLMIGFGFSCVPLNSFWRRALPTVEHVLLFIHFAGFIAILVPLWVFAPKASAEDVFINVVNSGGWDNTGLSMLVGSAAMLFTMAGPDSAVHMAEEIKDAAVNLPRAMVGSFLLNNILGFVILVTMCFTIGDLQDNLQLAQPFINTFTNGLNGPGASLGLTLILAILLFGCNATALATSSRQLWAFARDNGMPFSSWLAAIHPRYMIPMNAIWVCMGVNIVFALINLGSTVAFNIIISINLVGCLMTYIIAIGCLISARLRGQQLPHARWSLGKFGLPINVIAFFYACFMMVWSLFPIQVPVTAANMNWAVVIVAFVLFISLFFYLVQGRRTYLGPVAYVEGQRADGVVQATTGDEVRS